MNTPSQGLSPISPMGEQQGCGGGRFHRAPITHPFFFFLSGLQPPPPLNQGGLDACSPFGTPAGWRLTPASARPRPAIIWVLFAHCVCCGPRPRPSQASIDDPAQFVMDWGSVSSNVHNSDGQLNEIVIHFSVYTAWEKCNAD